MGEDEFFNFFEVTQVQYLILKEEVEEEQTWQWKKYI